MRIMTGEDDDAVDVPQPKEGEGLVMIRRIDKTDCIDDNCNRF
jgi:hypothetical protein